MQFQYPRIDWNLFMDQLWFHGSLQTSLCKKMLFNVWNDGGPLFRCKWYYSTVILKRTGQDDTVDGCQTFNFLKTGKNSTNLICRYNRCRNRNRHKNVPGKQICLEMKFFMCQCNWKLIMAIIEAIGLHRLVSILDLVD